MRVLPMTMHGRAFKGDPALRFHNVLIVVDEPLTTSNRHAEALANKRLVVVPREDSSSLCAHVNQLIERPLRNTERARSVLSPSALFAVLG